MNRTVGLWIDRNKAVIVSITNNVEERRIITSQMEHYVRHSSNVPGDGSAEDVRDRRFWNHLGEYYDKVIAQIGDAKAIQIFGPGEAKHELKKRLESEGKLDNIVSVDEAERLTDREITTRVRKRFPARSLYDIFEELSFPQVAGTNYPRSMDVTGDDLSYDKLKNKSLTKKYRSKDDRPSKER